MHIGLISDTHIPDNAKELPLQLKQALSDVDLILHAGDIYETSVLDELERLAPVLAAEGDDDPFTTHNDKRVKLKHTLSFEGVTIWLVHERPWFWHPKPEELPQVVVYGHSHSARLDRDDGVLFINPGSPTFPNYTVQLGTVALLTITSGKAEANIVQL